MGAPNLSTTSIYKIKPFFKLGGKYVLGNGTRSYFGLNGVQGLVLRYIGTAHDLRSFYPNNVSYLGSSE
jgi:hypothetical protein